MARWRDVLVSELTKLLTLRSVWVTLLVTAVCMVGLAWVSAPSVGEGIASGDPDLAPGTVAETVGLEFVLLGQIGVIVAGVMAAGSEQTSGQIKTSLVAVPARTGLLVVKATALLLVTLVVGIVTIPAVSLVSQVGLGDVGVIDGGVPTSLVLRWVGALAYWVGIALVSFALTVVLRQVLLPLFVLVAVSQLSLMLVVLTPASRFLPTVAGVQLFDPTTITAAFPAAALTPAAAATCLAAWVLVLLVAATWLFRTRDVRA
ncbi:hypothetical protein V5D56_06580 [Cellulosimicrobium sp. PMB13]|uniref:hypothetical protein n=1 Tax=Cellulosimicrobium sp. PMB13 TaxID=3120158 RepID=UPI003F4B5A10